MTTREGFGQTHDIAITVLVDNRADLMVESTETIKYFKDAPLLAEHGFSALLELKSEGIRILWDAGVTDIALLENMRRMKIDPASIDKIAISHGHHDHTASVLDLLEAMSLTPEAKEWPADGSAKEMASYAEGKRVPLIAHPAAFRERWSLDDEGKWYGPRGGPPKARWEAAGGEIVVSAEPYQLGQGCWTTGYVPRRSFEHSGRPSKMRYRDDLGYGYRRFTWIAPRISIAACQRPVFLDLDGENLLYLNNSDDWYENAAIPTSLADFDAYVYRGKRPPLSLIHI